MSFTYPMAAVRAIILLGLCAAVAPARAGFAQPVQPVQLAFGQKEAEIVFTADSPVKHAKALCECTSLRVEGSKLIARVDTGAFSQDVDKQIDATTADGVTTRLTMRFVVPQALSVSARSLIWKVGQPPMPQTLRIRIPKGSPVHSVAEAALSGEAFDYTPRIVKEGAEYAVDITPKSSAKKALNRLIIKTDSADSRYAAYIIYLSIQP